MTARHWMQVAALASALGLTGAAIAQNTEGTTSSEDRASISGSAMDAPSAGAIVTPEDKALGMGQGSARSDTLGGDANSGETISNDDELIVTPGRSGDEGSSVNPGASDDDESILDPGASDDEDLSVTPGPSSDDESSMTPAPSGETSRGK